mmetsp:Transcript_38932/g.93235  ORF Transcript_38932/g.93235 Transcript_38932/m.93235 type:complete len:203 (-) Transcript_38932:147-755(-)
MTRRSAPPTGSARRAGGHLPCVSLAESCLAGGFAASLASSLPSGRRSCVCLLQPSATSGLVGCPRSVVGYHLCSHSPVQSRSSQGGRAGCQQECLQLTMLAWPAAGSPLGRSWRVSTLTFVRTRGMATFTTSSDTTPSGCARLPWRCCTLLGHYLSRCCSCMRTLHSSCSSPRPTAATHGWPSCVAGLIASGGLCGRGLPCA